MKKKIQKNLSTFLLIVMLFNFFAPFIKVEAKETDTINQNETKIKKEEIVAKGNIEVELGLVLPVRNRENVGITFKIYDAKNQVASVSIDEVTKANEGYLEKNVKLGDQDIKITSTKRSKEGGLLSGVDYQNNISYYAVNVYGLLKGTYKIEMSGNHFVTYQKEVKLEDYSKRISFTNESGLFAIGDVNNDQKVDETDANLIISAIDANNTQYDLNLDGSIDIADLNYVTAVINGKKGQVKEENTNLILDNQNVSLDLPKEIAVEGDTSLEAIFNDNEVLSLKRADEKPISEENPIKLEVDLGKNKTDTVQMSEIRIEVGENAPTNVKAIIEDVNGRQYERVGVTTKVPGFETFTDESQKGDIVIDLKGQIAVKKVTIVITESSSSQLADIAKVEFLNNVKMELKEPEGFYTPKNIKVDTKVSEQLTVSFQEVPNVTGYKIKITGPKMEKGVVFETTFTNFTIEDLKNYATYKIAVCSVNGEWESKYSDEVEATPESNRKPPAPDMVTLKALYSGFEIGWKDMDDTKSYNIYYREVGTTDYLSVKEIKGTSYTLKGLKDAKEYEVYITGNNDLGEGSSSQIVKGKTLKAEAAITPKYKLINTTEEGKNVTNHIKDVIYTAGEMIGGDKFSMVDDNFLSYWELKSWTADTYYNTTGVPIIVLDKSYQMDEFVFTVPDSYPYGFKTGTYNPTANDKNDILVHYWNNADGTYTENTKNTVQGKLTKKQDENNRSYYLLKLEKPITASGIRLGLTVTNNNSLIQIPEVKIYEYDSLVNDVANLFVDDLRIELKSGVTQAKIDELRKRADVKSNGEYNPYREVILNDLQYAEDILNDKTLQDVITLNTNISNTYNSHTKFAMTINDYQPLGIVSKPNEKLTVYVGTNGKVNIELVFTQFHAEANKWQTSVRSLQKGQNIIDVPKIGDAEAERGGSVYVRYTSAPDVNNPIKIRVSGGTKIPVLDTTLLNTEAEKKEAIKTYLTELDNHINNIKKSYGADFDKYNSVLNSTEIATKQGLLSVAATAVKDAIDSGTVTTDSKVERLYKSTEAFDEMITFFYRQKGLSVNASDAKDEMPKARSNIRYMRMFDGAFMYAGGYHIGIEYGSIAGLVQSTGNTPSKTGYFGWGISHEVGHQINQSALVHAEVTNNVYALLAQTSNDKDKSRLEISGIYPKIYEKVTSHTLGKAQNVFVQLGMYWQLHLAYDNLPTFSDTNSIYARINHLTRTEANSEGFEKDDLLILYASMAAGYDLTDYFLAWGLKASDKLVTYMATLNLPKETRKIEYLNDEARRYRLSGGQEFSKDIILNASIKEVNNKEKQVVLDFEINKDKDKLLGYEILRNGESIAFVEGDKTSYIDRIGSENNRAYSYTIVAYDYLLNKTSEVTLDEIKISYDGSIASKDTFSIESNVKAEGEVVDLEDSDMDYAKLSVNKLIDGKTDTAFKGTSKVVNYVPNGDKVEMKQDTNNAYVIINLNDCYDISGIKYQALVVNDKLDANTISKYKISVSSDKVNWTVAREGTFNLNKDNNYTEIVYFMKEGTTSKTQLWTYNNISYVKIESVGNTKGLSGSEIDLIAPPGDNIDISLTADNVPTIGKLDKDYTYDASLGNDGIIKAGSVIIKGEYRGSPSFNIVTITDEKGTIYSGYQLLFAEVNDDMTVYDVASGTWMYILTKEEYAKLLKAQSIRANLYRVNDAETLDGQRLTSTSKSVTNLVAYENLPSMSITDTTKEKGNN